MGSQVRYIFSYLIWGYFNKFIENGSGRHVYFGTMNYLKTLHIDLGLETRLSTLLILFAHLQFRDDKICFQWLSEYVCELSCALTLTNLCINYVGKNQKADF